MQVTKKTKYTLIFSIIILLNFSVFAQETNVTDTNTDTLITQTDTTKTKHKFSFSDLFKHKKKNKTAENDTVSSSKKKFSLKNIFKSRKNKDDSANLQNNLISKDTTKTNKAFHLFKKNKNDSSDIKSTNEKPQRIPPGTWLKLNTAEQDSLLRAWDDYDRGFYVKKYKPTEKERQRDMKSDKNFIDKLILKRAVNKPYKYRKKLINRRIGRYRKTMKYDRLKKSETTPDDTVSDKRKYQLVNKQFKIKAKQEAIRKNKVALKYDKKEFRLRKRYSLSEKESKTLNKGKAMQLTGIDKITFNRAKHKQEKSGKKLLALRQKRSIALQNKEVQKKMKKDQKRIAKRDRKNAKKDKKKKGVNKKHDSSEYPKRYF